MPFTGSHPAAVLPFFATPLVPAALVIGSMSPDLPYFLPVPIAAGLTHSVAGVLGVDLLMGLVCFAMWVWLMTPAAVAIAGDGVRRRWGTRRIGWLEATHAGWQGTRYAQYGSGVIGAVILVTAVLMWWRRTLPSAAWVDRLPVASPRGAVTVWCGLAGAVLIGGLVGALIGYTGPSAGARHAAFLAATIGGAAGAAAALGFSCWWRLVRRSLDRPGRRPG